VSEAGGVIVRLAEASDDAAIGALYPSAFPDEELRPLVAALTAIRPEVTGLCALRGGALVGHALVSDCAVEGSPSWAGLLGPVAVHPDHQRQGVGGALIEAAIANRREAGLAALCVLGDPAYYARFGFEAETSLTAPYPLPED